MSDFELYLGEDVLQGEEEIPFYLMWKDQDFDKITITYSGFNKIAQLFNVDTTEIINEIPASKIKVDGYLGGTLVPAITNNPFLSASLNIVVHFSDGSIRELNIDRTIHTTRVAKVEVPKEIQLPSKHSIQIKLKGNSTVLIDIRECPESEIKLVYPKDIEDAMKQLIDVIQQGLIEIGDRFPSHAELIELIVNPDTRISFSILREKLDIWIKKANEDQEFLQALSSIWMASLAIQLSSGNPFLYATIEYFESRAANKSFLTLPLLCLNVPKGGGRLCLEFTMKDILGNECGEPVRFETTLQSNSELSVPIKDILRISRNEGGN